MSIVLFNELPRMYRSNCPLSLDCNIHVFQPTEGIITLSEEDSAQIQSFFPVIGTHPPL